MEYCYQLGHCYGRAKISPLLNAPARSVVRNRCHGGRLVVAGEWRALREEQRSISLLQLIPGYVVAKKIGREDKPLRRWIDANGNRLQPHTVIAESRKHTRIGGIHRDRRVSGVGDKCVVVCLINCYCGWRAGYGLPLSAASIPAAETEKPRTWLRA